MITANFIWEGGPKPSLHQWKTMYKSVAESMSREGGSVTSRSGWAASIAINYCQVRLLPYTA